MHELSIARNIVEIVEDVIRDQPDVRVGAVRVAVGRMVGVVHASLQFSFNAITSDTPLAGSALVIDDVPIRARCKSCHGEFTMDTFAAECAHCGGHSIDVIAGNELLVRNIEVHEWTSSPSNVKS